MLQRNLSSDESSGSSSTLDLTLGSPSVVGFANLAAKAIAGSSTPTECLSPEANAILVAAAAKGMLDLRVAKEGFDSSERLLAVCVEVDEEHRLLFRRKGQVRQTMQFLEGFRQLCQSGLVMHHLQSDFSLTVSGFDLAATLDQEDYSAELSYAVRVEF